MIRSREVLPVCAGLLLVAAWYLFATVPYLPDYPIPDWAEMGIAAPAYKLVSEGVYGNELFAGYHRSELRNYEYMPAYPLLVAASFQFFGLGLGAARSVSVLCGLLVIASTYLLGSRFDRRTGLIAAAFLATVPLAPAGEMSGVTLLDYSRVSRYDLLVPVFVLAASLTLLRALGAGERPTLQRRPGTWQACLAAGALAGLATLSHLYGAFTLPVLAGLLVWHCGVGSSCMRGIGLVVSGWLLAVLPWAVYVLADVPAWAGQMSRHETRLALLEPGFYADNLLREPSRYAAWVGGFPEGLLTPRLGIWIALVGVALGWRRLRAISGRRPRSAGHWSSATVPAARLLMLGLPLMGLQLAALVSLKRHVYVLLLLPFLAVLFAVGAETAWAWARRRRPAQVALLLLAGLAVLEGAAGIRNMLSLARQTTPYAEVVDRLEASIPADSRILLSQPYWLGFADHETRSLNLPILRAIEAQPDGLRGTWSDEVAAAAYSRSIRDIDPHFVVVERFWIDPTVPDPRGTTDARWERLWERLAGHLERECDDIVATVQDPSYGIIDVHRCR